jgi:hypothetical protein
MLMDGILLILPDGKWNEDRKDLVGGSQYTVGFFQTKYSATRYSGNVKL